MTGKYCKWVQSEVLGWREKLQLIRDFAVQRLSSGGRREIFDSKFDLFITCKADIRQSALISSHSLWYESLLHYESEYENKNKQTFNQQRS